MLPLDRTFRILQKAIWNGRCLESLTEPKEQDYERLCVSPFENPWGRLLPRDGGNESPSAADVDLLRAAYFATFPAID